MAVSIIIADDYPALRIGARMWLENQADFHVVGEAKNGSDCVRLVSRLRPDVLVTDVHMPEMNGFELLDAVRQASIDTRSVVWSPLPEEEYLLEALRKGALAFVLKTSPMETLVKAVRGVAKAMHFLDMAFSDRPMEVFLKKVQAEEANPVDALTPRENQVLHLVAAGASSSQVAQRLHISPRTVEQHRARMMRKLQLANQMQLARFALRRGIISWDD